MACHHRRGSSSSSTPTFSINNCDHNPDLGCPFGCIHGLDRNDIRETAYEIFFTACRSLPGFGGRNALTYYPAFSQDSNGGADFGGSSPSRGNGVGMATVSKVKMALGLKMMRRLSSRRTLSLVSNRFSSSPGSPVNGSLSPGRAFSTVPPPKPKRPFTSAEIMRQQMGVTEQSDNRLRKTLMRTLVGQMGRRAETIILPLELLRHLKPSEFNDLKEYHTWQNRQLKILETGLLLHPAVPLNIGNSFAGRLQEIISSAKTRPLDSGKNSESMRSLCNSVVSLSWRNPYDGTPPEICHWADGHPLNIHLYLALLRSIFDLQQENLVLDEVDELLELIKKTWSILGFNKAMHNMCLMWVLFEQYLVTNQAESDLLCASLAMMPEVGSDAKKCDRDGAFVKMLGDVLRSIQCWAEKRLIDYHDAFQRGSFAVMENLLPLALSCAEILEDLVDANDGGKETPGNHVDYYIRSSIKNAFNRMLEIGNAVNLRTRIDVGIGEKLLELAKEIEEASLKEKECFSPLLKKWHPIATGVAAVTLHNCYGTLLQQYLAGVSTLTSDIIPVLQRATYLENHLVQMVVEDSTECEDGGKAIIREMVPYEVDSIVLNLLKAWMDERLMKAKDCIQRAKKTETWNPMSKIEPYAQSSMELVRLARETLDDFFEIPIGISEYVVQDLANGLEGLFRDYAAFVASCGSKQSYIPTLPPLTRCNKDSKLVQLWRKATPCSVSPTNDHQKDPESVSRLAPEGVHHPSPSTSRGTQRLYIRINTLHHLIVHLNSLNKILTLAPRVVPNGRRYLRASYFDLALSSIVASCHHVSEVAAYRLVFLDLRCPFYESLYVDGERIRPVLRTLKQDLDLLCTVVNERAQGLAVREVMRACLEAYLMVLLAGGCSRVFTRWDHGMIREDLEGLKKVFLARGVAEEWVEREAETAGGIVGLMGEETERLVEDFSALACEASGMGVLGGGGGGRLPMPPTTGRWNRSDPNTILRVLCHRNDRAANEFLKNMFQLAKRR